MVRGTESQKNGKAPGKECSQGLQGALVALLRAQIKFAFQSFELARAGFEFPPGSYGQRRRGSRHAAAAAACALFAELFAKLLISL
eukprot:6641617-Prymnesium_polylepis.1